MNSSCATLKRLCRKKYSCEDKKNAIKYLCSTVWQREGTLLYENPNNAPGKFAGLQLFELPVDNKHEDEECNHYVGYSLQGVPDATNEELLGAGGTFFSTSIDGYNWSRQSYSASWNEENGHFDCKIADLDDKSNYMFTLGMNKPTKISWRGYETNVISINPTDLDDGDSGFSGAGYYIALPNESPSNYPSYEKIYSLAGWGGTAYIGDKYFKAILRTDPATITDEKAITEEEKAQDLKLADFDIKSTLTGLERMDISVNIDDKPYRSAFYMKWDKTISLSEANNIQTGNCVLCYPDGISKQVESVKGVYYAKYNANRETVLEVICGLIETPTVKMDITRDSSTNFSSIKITALNLSMSVYEPDSNIIIQLSESTLVNLNLIHEDQSIAVRSRKSSSSNWVPEGKNINYDNFFSYPIAQFNQASSNKFQDFKSELLRSKKREHNTYYWIYR
jgi:hypothetical protein